MKTSYARNVSQQAFNELVEAIEGGKSQKLVEYLKTMGRFHSYSLGNAILIGFQKPYATRVAGFRTWQKLGRHVKRNEKGIAIMAPIVRHRKVKRVGDKEENEQKSEDKIAVAFKTAYVFDISQTDGKLSQIDKFHRYTVVFPPPKPGARIFMEWSEYNRNRISRLRS